MIALTGPKAPSGGVLTLADAPAPIVVPKGSRLLVPTDAGDVARYVKATTAYYDANEICRKAVRP
jgi:hypothetical protein